MCSAITAQRLEKSVSCGRPVKQCACRFIENSETGIVPLDILFRADPAVGIWWITARNKASEGSPDSVENETRGGGRRKAEIPRKFARCPEPCLRL